MSITDRTSQMLEQLSLQVTFLERRCLVFHQPGANVMSDDYNVLIGKLPVRINFCKLISEITATCDFIKIKICVGQADTYPSCALIHVSSFHKVSCLISRFHNKARINQTALRCRKIIKYRDMFLGAYIPEEEMETLRTAFKLHIKGRYDLQSIEADPEAEMETLDDDETEVYSLFCLSFKRWDDANVTYENLRPSSVKLRGKPIIVRMMAVSTKF